MAVLTYETDLEPVDVVGGERRTVTTAPRTDAVARLRRWLPFFSDPEPRRVETVEQLDGLAVSDLRRLMAYHQVRQGK